MLIHPAGRALTSDWSVNSFIMVVYEKSFFQFSLLAMIANSIVQSSTRTLFTMFFCSQIPQQAYSLIGKSYLAIIASNESELFVSLGEF